MISGGHRLNHPCRWTRRLCRVQLMHSNQMNTGYKSVALWWAVDIHPRLKSWAFSLVLCNRPRGPKLVGPSQLVGSGLWVLDCWFWTVDFGSMVPIRDLSSERKHTVNVSQVISNYQLIATGLGWPRLTRPVQPSQVDGTHPRNRETTIVSTATVSRCLVVFDRVPPNPFVSGGTEELGGWGVDEGHCNCSRFIF